MTTDDLTGAALDEAIARALGWQQILGGWVNPDGGGELMLRWSWDVSAALALCLDVAREHLWTVEIAPYEGGYNVLFSKFTPQREEVYDHSGEGLFVRADDLATALARLALAAL